MWMTWKSRGRRKLKKGNASVPKCICASRGSLVLYRCAAVLRGCFRNSGLSVGWNLTRVEDAPK